MFFIKSCSVFIIIEIVKFPFLEYGRASTINDDNLFVLLVCHDEISQTEHPFPCCTLCAIGKPSMTRVVPRWFHNV
jgi:hypothetical protein